MASHNFFSKGDIEVYFMVCSGKLM